MKFKDHRIAIILAILTSVIVVLPQIWLRSEPYYQGIELIPDSPWSARVREIQDGHGFGSIYYKDGKDDPYLHVPLGSMIVAYMGSMFSLDINNTILLSRLILPFVTFLLIYAFVFLFSRDKLAAISSASVILLADSLMDYSHIPKLLTNTLRGISPSSFLEISRPVYSLMIFAPFFAFMAAFWKFFRERKWQWGIVSAVLLGLNFYNYFYLWSYLYAFGAILVLIFLMRSNWREAIRISWVFIGALVVGIPYALNLYHAANHPLYQELSQRHGIVISHSPIFVGYLVIASLILFFLWFPKAIKEDREKCFFSLALLLTPFITLNQQLITGQVLQTGHYHWYLHKPIAIIFAIVILFYWLSWRSHNSYKRILAIFIISVSFATGAFVQAASYFNDTGERDGGYVAIERQKYGPVMKWLNDNVEKEAVVLANNEISHITVIYTSLNVAHHRSAQLFLSASEDRLLDTRFTFYRISGVGIEDARETFLEDIRQVSADVYGIYYRETHGSYDALRDEKLPEILARYKEGLETPTSKWLYDVFEKYEVEYIIWDKAAEPSWDLERFDFMEKVFEYGTMAIYRINK